MYTLNILEIIPLGNESKTHHLMQTSGICFKNQKTTKEELLKNIFASRSEVGVTSDVFQILDSNQPEWHQENFKEKVVLIFDIAELSENWQIIEFLLKQDFAMHVLFHKLPNFEQIIWVHRIIKNSKRNKITYLESHLASIEDLKNAINVLSLPNLTISFLPKLDTLDLLLTPEEAMIRLAVRQELARMAGLGLEVISFKSAGETLSQKASFYSNPEKTQYIKLIAGKANHVAFVFDLARNSGLPFFIGYLLILQRLLAVGIRNLIYQIIEVMQLLKYYVRNCLRSFRVFTWNIIMYPLKKVFWFSKYQLQKRVIEKLKK